MHVIHTNNYSCIDIVNITNTFDNDISPTYLILNNRQLAVTFKNYSH